MSAAVQSAAHILLAEDEGPLAAILEQHLRARGHRVACVADGAAALRALDREAFDVAMLDISMPAPDGLQVLRALSAESDRPAVIVTTGSATIDAAVQAMQLGAFAYLAKPYRMAELDVVLGRALEHRRLAHENVALRAQVARAEGADAFLTRYAPLKAVLAVAMEAAAGSGAMLITGEPGAGKCSLARLVHARSARSGGPFAYVTAAALAGADAERILFGSARAPRRAALASAGTLYLGDAFALPARAQRRLAHALRSGRFRPDGAMRDLPVRARIVAGATAVPGAPRLRSTQTLVDILGSAVIALPPLRERAVDIPLLANAFVQCAGDAESPRIEAAALELLQRYAWPGNVAELRAVMERARLLARGRMIRADNLPLDAASDGSLQLTDVERRHIAAVLRTCGWHQGRTAAALDISPKTLYRKIRAYGLARPRPDLRE